MTSTAKASSQLWKVPRILPTMPSNISTLKFFGRQRKSNRTSNNGDEPQMQTQWLSSFEARIHPIPPIQRAPATHASGPLILRSFIHARTRYARLPFRTKTDGSLEAVYDSMRIDGLPRVVFAVGKDVEQGLRGKLHGYLRGKFKRRGRMAFQLAMEEIRKNNPLWRCDLDILFIIKKQSMMIPFSEVVDEMKKCLLKVNPKIVGQGLKNTNLSQRYMSDHTKPPPHILKVVAQEMGVDDATPEELIELRKKLIDKRNQQIDRIQWDECTVTGRYHDMALHEDGTMIPVDTTEMTQKMEREQEFTRKSLRETMSFNDVRKMFPTMHPRALRLYQRYSRTESDTSQESWASTFDDPSFSTSDNSRPRHLNSQGTSSSSQPSLPDIEPEQALWAGTQPASQRRRESFKVYEPSNVRTRRHLDDAVKSTPFKSSIRPTPDIPGLPNEAASPQDETFDYLFGDETSTSSPPTTERRNQHFETSTCGKRDDSLSEEGNSLPRRDRHASWPKARHGSS